MGLVLLLNPDFMIMCYVHKYQYKFLFSEQTIRPGAQGPGEQTGAEIHRQTV